MKANLLAVSCALAGCLVSGLHVTQWQDSLAIAPGEYIEVDNANEMNVISEVVDDETQLKQDLTVSLVSAALARCRRDCGASPNPRC
mgnify:CR=1 FL=1